MVFHLALDLTCCVSCHNKLLCYKQSISQIPALCALFPWLKKKQLRSLVFFWRLYSINSPSIFCSTNELLKMPLKQSKLLQNTPNHNNLKNLECFKQNSLYQKYLVPFFHPTVRSFHLSFTVKILFILKELH